MALGKITKTAVDRLQPGGQWLWDTHVVGFGARRQIDGVFYYLRYRLGGLQRIKWLGRHGHLIPRHGQNKGEREAREDRRWPRSVCR
jgi:hypothetical protein